MSDTFLPNFKVLLKVVRALQAKHALNYVFFPVLVVEMDLSKMVVRNSISCVLLHCNFYLFF